MRLSIACAFGFAILPRLAAANSYYVDAHGSSSGNGSAAHPFKTIALGLAAAADGDTVLVAHGTYAEGPVVIDKSVSLVGSLRLARDARGLPTDAVAGTQTIIRGNPSAGQEVITILASHVTVRGFIVDSGAPFPSASFGIGIHVAGDEAPGGFLTGIVIADSWISDAGFGIYVISADAALTGNLVGEGAQARLEGRLFHGNFFGVLVHGSDIDRPASVSLDHMRVNRNVQAGMVVVGGAHLGANRPDGVRPTGKVILDVDSSDFSYSGSLGIHVLSRPPFGGDPAYPSVVDMTMHRSTITGNVEYGLVIDNAGESESPWGCGNPVATTFHVDLSDHVELAGNSRAGTLVTTGDWARSVGYGTAACYYDGGSVIDASVPTTAGLDLDVPYCAATLVPDAYAPSCSPLLGNTVFINGSTLTPGVLAVSPKTF